MSDVDALNPDTENPCPKLALDQIKNELIVARGALSEGDVGHADAILQEIQKRIEATLEP